MRHVKICASLVMLVLVAGPAFAQQPQDHEQHHSPETPPAAASPGMRGGMMSGAGGMPMMAAMAGHVEGRLAFLKTELKITDAQLPLWNAVADAIRANAKGIGAMAEGMMGSAQAATLPDKLVTREKMLAARLEALRKLEAAVDPLYAALSDEQKKTADELIMGPMGMM
jgi:hypothetical protein